MSDLDPTVAWDVAGAIAKLLAVDPEDGTTVIGIAHEPNGGVIPVWGFHEGYAMRLAETAITALTEAGWSPPAADDDEEVEPSVETIDADTIRGMAAIEQIRCRDVSAEIELDEDEPSVESLLDEADLMMWPAHHEPDELVRARFRSIVHGAIAKLGEVSEEAGKLRAEVEQLREAVAPQAGEISREELLQRSKRVLVDCVLAQIPQVRFLQQELGKAGMEIAKVWEEANQANAQRDDYGRELVEFRRLHLEHLARCNQEAHRESLLNIWDMVKKAEAESDLAEMTLKLARIELRSARQTEQQLRALHEEFEGRCTHCVEYCDCDPKSDDCTHGNVESPCRTIQILGPPPLTDEERVKAEAAVKAAFYADVAARGWEQATGATVGPDAYPSQGGAVPEAPGANEAVDGPTCTTGQGMTVTGSLPGLDGWNLFIPAKGDSDA